MPNNAFAGSSINQAHYGYERVWYNYAASVASPLTPGLNPIFDVSEWNPNDDNETICILDRIAVTQNAGVRLRWCYDGKQSDVAQNWTDAYPAGMRWVKRNVVARQRLALFVDNQTGAAITSGFLLNYAVTVKNPSVSEDLLLGITPSETDVGTISTLNHLGQGNQMITAMSELRDAVNKGTQPITFARVLEFLVDNRLLPDDPMDVPFHLTIPAGTALYTFSPPRNIAVSPGEIYIVRGIALEGAPAILLFGDRDNDSQYIANYGTGWTQADERPWDPFIPFTKKLNIYATPLANLATATTYPGNLDISRFKLSDLLSLHMRLKKTPAQNYAKVTAGWQ